MEGASTQTRSDSLFVIALVVSVMAVVIAIIGTGFALRAIDESKAGDAGSGGDVIEVALADFSISPKAISAGAGSSLHVTNNGGVQHNLVVDGHEEVATPLIDVGGAATLDLGGLATGGYTMRCTVPGHAEAGMTATLTLGEGGGGAAPAEPQLSAEEIDKLTEQSIKDFVAGAETEGKGAQLLEPEILRDGTKQYRLTASEFDWEVSPGKKVKAFGYNGVVPGPMIKATSGDRLRVIFKNELPESSSVHWHGVHTPNSMDGVPSVTQDPVKKGETFVYEFVAQGPAVGLYHAHQNSQKQVPMGLLGPIIVDDLPVPEGVTVSQRIPMVLNDAGNIGLSLNGKSFPATDPIKMKVGEYAIVDYMNEGMQIHPMHTHGFHQTVIALDGIPLAQPFGQHTVLIAPGQSVSVLVKADRPGVWLFHCHILNHAESERGYFGMATAIIAE